MTARKTIRKLRRLHGLTHADLAEYIGVSRSTVTRWEDGTRRPLPRHRVRLEACLKLPLGSLEEDEGVVDPTPGATTAAIQKDPHRAESETSTTEAVIA